jgi:molecular chaperone GrpE
MEFLRINTESEPRIDTDAERTAYPRTGLEIPDDEREAGDVAVEEVDEESEEPGVTLDDLADQIRRVGREVFKANRASERNQELFESGLEELRQLAGRVAQAPDASAEAVFQAKASLGKELVEVLDSLEAGVTAAEDLLARLEEQAAQPEHGLVYRFAAGRELREALRACAAMMRQWHEGQRLLAERLTLALRGSGIRAIEPLGRPFDPALQRAVAVEERSDLPAGMVVGEERKGYTLDGRVLRYAEVRVTRG